MHFNKSGILFLLLVPFIHLAAQKKVTISLVKSGAKEVMLYKASSPLIQYTGRLVTGTGSSKKFWQPGVYFTAKFNGTFCDIFLNDENLYKTSHNYIEVIVDNITPARLQAIWENNVIKVAGLSNGNHIITVCKNTEAGIGFLEFTGMNCKNLLPLPVKPVRKIEYIGNSITCGAGTDISEVPCDKGKWYDQHNAYMSYGAVTSRALHAQWVLSSVSGIGLVYSCCNMNITMPQVFDKINMRDNVIPWDFNVYIPDVVTVCLGQNDGMVDSMIYCNTYVNFLKDIRQKYPNADVVCLTSPMADASLAPVLKKYITSIVAQLNTSGDIKMYKYFFSRQYHGGCGGHPDLNEHKLIAAELTRYIKNLKHW